MDLTGGRIPDHGVSVELGRDEPLAVGAERHVDDLGPGMADEGGSRTCPLQVIPFPAAQLRRAVGQKLVDPAQLFTASSRSARAIRLK